MKYLTRAMHVERRILVKGLQRGPSTPHRNTSCQPRHCCVSLLSDGRSFPFGIHRNDCRLQTQGMARFFFKDTESVESLQKAILDNVKQGDVDKADHALARLEKLAQTSCEDSSAYPDLDTYTRVLDAWVHQQKQVDEGPNQVNEMFQAADHAHKILEKLQRKSSEQADSNSAFMPAQHHYDAVLRAWLNVTRAMLQAETPLRGIPQRAQRILEQMEEQAHVKPSVDHYNAVIETWGNSPEHLRASMAEKLFDKMSGRIRPTNETYLILIRAWCRSKQDRAAFSATGHLMKMQRKMGQDDDGVEITMDDYHTILEAWTRAADKLAPTKAFFVLKLMQNAYMDRRSDLRPDETCYRYVLATYARSTLPNLGTDVDEMISQMVDRQLTPDSECYTNAIRTWKNSATHHLCETQHVDATHANRLLNAMEKAYHRSSEVLVQPTTENYNNVIEAWSASTQAGAAVHAEALLKKLEKAYEDGDENLKPDTSSYRWALEAWATSPSSDKMSRAVTILSRMKDATEGSEDDHVKPNVDVFNAFIRVCGTSGTGSAGDMKYNLKLAVNTVDEMRKRGEAPNSRTFCLLLEACQNLLPLGKKQSRAVENIFRHCCYLGLVDDAVLAQFRDVAPDQLFQDLVVANTTEEVIDGLMSGKMVPLSWTRNVGVKVVAVDGKQPKPLNIDAIFVVTKRVKEFRVRRLRQRKNTRLFRAGRKLYVKNSRMAEAIEDSL